MTRGYLIVIFVLAVYGSLLTGWLANEWFDWSLSVHKVELDAISK